MSNYRDDTQETAVASSSLWLGLKSVAESSAKITASLMLGLGVVYADSASISDQVIDRQTHLLSESAFISEHVADTKKTTHLIVDSARVSDFTRHSLTATHADSASITDAVYGALMFAVADQARLSDQVDDHRNSLSLVTESAALVDHTFRSVSDYINNGASATDAVVDARSSKALVAESAAISDWVFDAARLSLAPAIDHAVAGDTVLGVLHARDTLTDQAVVMDEVVGASDYGQAWTANIDTWAMSRYQPYSFTRLVVIDGTIFGESAEGVYALSGGAEAIDGALITGKIDMSGGTLTRPIAAYVEYELSGTAEMGVVTTQSGSSDRYAYTLPVEMADNLTNGRIQFGRGLKGRHFAFDLRMRGQHGRINDLTIQTAQSKRRI